MSFLSQRGSAHTQLLCSSARLHSPGQYSGGSHRCTLQDQKSTEVEARNAFFLASPIKTTSTRAPGRPHNKQGKCKARSCAPTHRCACTHGSVRGKASFPQQPKTRRGRFVGQRQQHAAGYLTLRFLVTLPNPFWRCRPGCRTAPQHGGVAAVASGGHGGQEPGAGAGGSPVGRGEVPPASSHVQLHNAALCCVHGLVSTRPQPPSNTPRGGNFVSSVNAGAREQGAPTSRGGCQ